MTESNDLLIESIETESKKKSSKCSKPLGTTADMMKQFHRARISLRDMGKDYTVLTINQANKETLSLEKSSNIVAQTIEVNATNSISKLQTKNISNNIKTEVVMIPMTTKK